MVFSLLLILSLNIAFPLVENHKATYGCKTAVYTAVMVSKHYPRPLR